ncbi:SDR family NAD(P)-dependent oxidoreductase [Oceanobacillus profundus]|uniref:SDR family NAD(P)-dependent oxidoreductase n=1 Tax=Oceanobacillus profundus TaxID=372463 RepID=UPI0036442915
MDFKGKKILIIGGTGTIGKSIVQAVMKDDPQVIKIFSRDEYKQYLLQNELGNTDIVRFIIGDIRDYDSLFSAMHNTDYVFHLAAMKHVDTCEYNPLEGVKTNVLGTNNVIKAAISQNVKKVVFTSSDKANSPTNTYGATKLIAERLISSAQSDNEKGKTIFASVRFGNVMGSSGSVIPLFKEQVMKNKKITLTDKNMTRFMMSLNQATQLTIKSMKEAKGGEVFVLKMPVIKLGDLVDIIVEEMCEKYKINNEEIDIEIIGLRPGEKMYEELMTYDESREAWELPDMYVIPGKSNMEYIHSNAKKLNPGNYSSLSQEPLGINKVRALLEDEKLI